MNALWRNFQPVDSADLTSTAFISAGKRSAVQVLLSLPLSFVIDFSESCQNFIPLIQRSAWLLELVTSSREIMTVSQCDKLQSWAHWALPPDVRLMQKQTKEIQLIIHKRENLMMPMSTIQMTMISNNTAVTLEQLRLPDSPAAGLYPPVCWNHRSPLNKSHIFRH